MDKKIKDVQTKFEEYNTKGWDFIVKSLQYNYFSHDVDDLNKQKELFKDSKSNISDYEFVNQYRKIDAFDNTCNYVLDIKTLKEGMKLSVLFEASTNSEDKEKFVNKILTIIDDEQKGDDNVMKHFADLVDHLAFDRVNEKFNERLKLFVEQFKNDKNYTETVNEILAALEKHSSFSKTLEENIPIDKAEKVTEIVKIGKDYLDTQKNIATLMKQSEIVCSFSECFSNKLHQNSSPSSSPSLSSNFSLIVLFVCSLYSLFFKF